MKLKIRCDLVGFNFLSYAIELVIEEPSLIHKLCTDLYVKISKKFNIANEKCIERNIRHAIDRAYEANGLQEINNMFGAKVFADKQKPAAGELIKLLAEYYTLGLYKNQHPSFQSNTAI